MKVTKIIFALVLNFQTNELLAAGNLFCPDLNGDGYCGVPPEDDECGGCDCDEEPTCSVFGKMAVCVPQTTGGQTDYYWTRQPIF